MKLISKRIMSDWAYKECLKNSTKELRELIITKLIYSSNKYKKYIDELMIFSNGFNYAINIKNKGINT